MQAPADHPGRRPVDAPLDGAGIARRDPESPADPASAPAAGAASASGSEYRKSDDGHGRTRHPGRSSSRWRSSPSSPTTAASTRSMTSGPVRAPPSLRLSARHRRLRHLRAHPRRSRARRSRLLVGLTASVITMAIGTLVGIIAGYRGGGVDTFLMRITDFALVLPWLALAIVLASIIGPRSITIILVIGAHVVAEHRPGWCAPRCCRSENGPTSNARGRSAAANCHMIVRHVLPNVDAGDPGQHRARGGDRDPVRDRPVVPGPRRPARAPRGAAILEDAFIGRRHHPG